MNQSSVSRTAHPPLKRWEGQLGKHHYTYVYSLFSKASLIKRKCNKVKLTLFY